MDIMELKKFLLLLSAIIASLIFVVSCGVHPTTPSPSYSPSETTQVTPTPSYTPPKTSTNIVTSFIPPTRIYTPSGAIEEKLHEVAQAFGRDIPIPIYLPEEYAITDAQFIQQGSDNYVEITITAPDKPDINMQITWFHGVFRLLPPSDNYKYFSFSDGNGTYDSVVLAYYSDHNALWWDWVPETLSLNDLRPLVYYEMVLSASTNVPDEELVNIARFVRIP